LSNWWRVLIVVIGLIAISPFVNHASAQSAAPLGGSTTSYPTNVAHGSCATYSGYIYCVGGGTGLGSTPAVYFAPVSSSGVGAWTSTTRYPTTENYQSCATYSGYIYCVGGYIGGGNVLSAVYFAPISSSGVDAWKSTTRYPTTIDYQSCVIYSGYIYCVGGSAPSTPSGFGGAYFAPVSSSGVGAWTSTTSYPTKIEYQSCATDSGYIYCVGGFTGSTPLNTTSTSSAYFAPVSSSGVGAWTSTTSYPAVVTAQSCATYSGYIYCVGGYVGAYFAPVSSSGVGTWTSTASYFATTYSEDVEGQSCATDSGYIYCVGGQPVSSTGYTSAVYYADLTSNFNNYVTMSSTSTTLTTSSSTSVTTTSTSTSSTTPEFPSGSLAVIALVVVATVAVLSRKFHLRQPTRIS
jgi:hypothetical protein